MSRMTDLVRRLSSCSEANIPPATQGLRTVAAGGLREALNKFDPAQSEMKQSGVALGSPEGWLLVENER
jgi:hypothetical protein